jgi:flagellar biosynthesis/type III secretory pathway M-ring protein FliF/YscJ
MGTNRKVPSHTKPISKETDVADPFVTKQEAIQLREKIIQLADKSPKKAAIILAHWLRQPAGTAKTKKAA